MANNIQCRALISGIEDWRNNAGVVFTGVTIIFLPLSFVTGLLGMNTADVRNATYNQWVFWASAVPLTFLVIANTLYFVEVPPLRRWWARRQGKVELLVGDDMDLGQNSFPGVDRRPLKR
jgi:hypothetical protein